MLIITATIQDENPSRKPEDFWLELAQSIGSPIPLLLSEKTRRIMSTIFALHGVTQSLYS